MKKIIIDESKCTGCGECVPQCREGAIKIINGKARIVAELCDQAGACIGKCPQDAISFEEEEKKETACGCPGAHIMSFDRKKSSAPAETSSETATSELTTWPVQLRLVPPIAPFLQNADLLVAADCVPCAYPDFHRVLLKGKALLVGCPKFDDLALYKDKLGQIIEVNAIKSITYAHMEVPCCLGLKRVIEEAIVGSKKQIPFHDVVITVRGEKK